MMQPKSEFATWDAGCDVRRGTFKRWCMEVRRVGHIKLPGRDWANPRVAQRSRVPGLRQRLRQEVVGLDEILVLVT